MNMYEGMFWQSKWDFEHPMYDSSQACHAVKNEHGSSVL